MRLNAPRAACAVSVLRAGGQGQVMPAIYHMIITEAVTEIVLRFYSFIQSSVSQAENVMIELGASLPAGGGLSPTNPRLGGATPVVDPENS